MVRTGCRWSGIIVRTGGYLIVRTGGLKGYSLILSCRAALLLHRSAAGGPQHAATAFT